MWKATIFLSMTLAAGGAHTAEPRTEHTWQLSEGESRPAATIEDAAMLVGAWSGTAFGQHFGGLSFYRRGEDRMDGYIVMRNGDQVSEQALVFERVNDAE